ncbi:MAG TPA: GAF domain-containing protein, partial [Stellaceae bacterium]|nr:GAF domain-containing protein [Stellaceae bacterium]
MSAETPSLPALPAAAPPVAPGSAAPRRGKLFRKYVLFFVGLVAAALLVNGGVEFWFGYRENKAAMVRMQQLKADAAAQRIQEFVEEIERQIGWTTHAQWSAAPLDQRRFDYVRLLSQVPAITEISELDREGKEQLKVSRLAMDVVGSGQDFSQSPAFIEARAHKVWFSPVYFRKESEPYMTLAMARAGRNAGVTVAEVNLKLIWDVITAMKIGQGGYAYVVGNHGRLIAHPDISLVLRDTDFAHLPQVAKALRPAGGGPPAASTVSVATNSEGRSVLSAHATIGPLGWLVFVEVPLNEALAPLYRAALRHAGLLATGLIVATLAALFLARRMTVPIREMQEGAARIGAGALDQRLDIRTGDELEALAAQFNNMAGDLQSSYAELEHKVEERTAELSESLEYQTATSDVLKVISRSSFDLQPVLQSVVDTAIRLCRADQAVIFRNEGGEYRWAAGRGNSPEYEEIERDVRFQPGTGSLVGRTALEGRAVQILDSQNDPDYELKADASVGGVRTLLGVPLLRQGEVVGVIGLARQRVEAFTEKQIELVTTFADQAVIAIENARLITETREALEQQTATAEVLGVINSSPGDLSPVFAAILERAMTRCAAAFGFMTTYDGERFTPCAMRDVPKALADYFAKGMDQPRPGEAHWQLLQGADLVHNIDQKDDDAYRSGSPLRHAVVDLGGTRTALVVALRKDGALRGTLTLYRQEVRPFTDKHISLVQNFAAQAVIAMENARLITETQEALEQQTATAEVLETISSSPGCLEPVFDAVLANAVRICGGTFGMLSLVDGTGFRGVAAAGVNRAISDNLSRLHHPPPGTGLQRLQESLETVQVADCAADPAYDAVRVANPPMVAVRTALHVPMMKEDALLGAIMIYRDQVAAFTSKEVELVEGFAKQAVIAIENARLITETQEALDQQTATAEVLGVINASPGDLTPVFDAMLEKAIRLCEAQFGFFLRHQDGKYAFAAGRGLRPAFAEYLHDLDQPSGYEANRRIAEGATLLHFADLKDDEVYQSGAPFRRAVVDIGGGRTAMAVAMRRKDGELLGTFSLFRYEVRPFTEKQTALVENFAAQAVIAMENARLLEEIRQRQAELRVTFDNMADGVAMFDAELRLAAWNRNFQELLELPDEFLDTPHSYGEFIRYLAGRGEFGEVDPDAELARLEALYGDHYSFERTRPTGMILEVHHNPMPEGGFVLIYSDITERKRSETVIREARDAAEAALTDLKAAQGRLIQAEKMASLGQLTAGIAHEIKNPLNFV